MSKASQKSAKYMVRAEFKSPGVVEKPDVIGAVFGQTEGLLGDELDLRELQRKGKIGRIDVEVENSSDGSEGRINIPTSIEAADTALIAASLETIERVGPANADIKVKSIEDMRVSKRDYIVKRAKQLLKEMKSESPEKVEVTEEVKKEVRKEQEQDYMGFRAGPGVETSEEIVIVEGRADLNRLLESGVNNVLSVGGTNVPEGLEDATSGREVTVFVDGDRGGELLLKELVENIDIDNRIRAPEGREVEELPEKKIHELLRDRKEKTEEVEAVEKNEEVPEEVMEIADEIFGSRAACIVDEENKVVERVPVDSIGEVEAGECGAVVVDTAVKEEHVDKAEELDADYVVGMGKKRAVNSSDLIIEVRKERIEN